MLEQSSGQDLEVFYPSVQACNPVNPRAARERAYFPGYLFVHLDLAAVGVNELRWLPAAVGLLEFGGEPAVVPRPLSPNCKRRVATIQAAGGMVFADLEARRTVKYHLRPFAGYEAIFDLRLRGSDRVRVLLEMLRRQVPWNSILAVSAKRRLRPVSRPARASSRMSQAVVEGAALEALEPAPVPDAPAETMPVSSQPSTVSAHDWAIAVVLACLLASVYLLTFSERSTRLTSCRSSPAPRIGCSAAVWRRA